jgi:hypothetical protein
MASMAPSDQPQRVTPSGRRSINACAVAREIGARSRWLPRSRAGRRGAPARCLQGARSAAARRRCRSPSRGSGRGRGGCREPRSREFPQGVDEAGDLPAAVRRSQRDAQARASPGTVGGRIAGTHSPRSSRALAMRRVSWLSPTITGWIAVGEDKSCQRVSARPSRNWATSCQRCARRASPFAIRARLALSAQAMIGLLAVVKM